MIYNVIRRIKKKRNIEIMKYFLDSAKTHEILYARENWGISGVTTNPKHIMEGNLSLNDFLGWIKNEVASEPDFPVFVEINPHLTDCTEMVSAAEKLSAYCGNFVIKIPCCEQGLSAIYKLSKKGIRTASTLVFTSAQAIQAANAGAEYAAPFIGRIDEINGKGLEVLKEIVTVYRDSGYKTKVLAAALRGARHIAEAALAGSDCMTCGFEMIKKSFEHPLTQQGIDKFITAWDNTDTEGWN